MEPSGPTPLARWNPARDVWETDTTDLFCELSGVFSETWPKSGMTRGGTAYALPISEPPTDGDGCSSSPTLLATPRSALADARNQTVWERPLDQPQNLENQLARLP